MAVVNINAVDASKKKYLELWTENGAGFKVSTEVNLIWDLKLINEAAPFCVLRQFEMCHFL